MDYLQALDPNESLSLADLLQKCAMLLALASLCRVSELAGINRRSIVVKGSIMRISLSSPRKSQLKIPHCDEVCTVELQGPLTISG